MAISNLYIDQGTDFSTSVELADGDGELLNLTDCTASAQIRKNYSSISETSLDITFHSDRSLGIITMSLTNSVTAIMEPGMYFYDLLLTMPTQKLRPLEGSVFVNPGVTK
jgi:hypothetical protein